MAYGRGFYEHHETTARRSAEAVVPLAIGFVAPTSVVDVGCGAGTWLAAFREAGVRNIWGVDGPWVHEEILKIPADCFQVVDVSRPFRLGRRFDLAVCLEVAEHIPAAGAEGLVESLVALAPVILFSAAIPNQGGTHHVNEQWPDYWIQRFRTHGFVPVDCLRARLWRNEDIAWWYAQNALFFVEEAALDRYPALAAAYDPSAPPLALVHPRRYLETADPHDLSIRTLLGALRSATVRRLRSRRGRA